MDFEAILGKLTDPDTAPEGLLDLRQAWEKNQSDINALQEETQKKDAKIAELRDTNMKLYMRISSPEPEQPKEPTAEEQRQAFNEEMRKSYLDGYLY